MPQNNQSGNAGGGNGGGGNPYVQPPDEMRCYIALLTLWKHRNAWWMRLMMPQQLREEIETILYPNDTGDKQS